MDEPIIYPRYKISRDSWPCQSILYQSLSFALANDDKNEFMRLVKDPGFKGVRHSFPANKIFYKDALEIATAVFNGETKGLIDMEDVLKDGMTPLHLAANNCAPRLTKYLVQRGDKVDAVCDYERLNLKHATPADIVIETFLYKDERRSLFWMLWWLCYHNRNCMEVIRILVRSTQNTTWATQSFFKYAHKGELVKLAGLFLAVPELFLSSSKSGLSLLSKLNFEINSLKNKTHIEEQLSLLLDVFALVGHKIAAYIRLEEFAVKSCDSEEIEQSFLELDFFIREVAQKKLGVSSPDYYLRFFETGKQISGDDDLSDWEDCTSDLEGNDVFYYLSDLLTRKDFDRTNIYRLIPSLERQDAARLTTTIEKKLSSLSALHDSIETAKTSNLSKKGEKHQPLGFPLLSSRCFEPGVRSFHTSTGSANRMFGVKFTPTKSWENKVIQSTKLKSFHTSTGSANRMFGVKFTPMKSWENKVIQSTKPKSFLSFVKLSHFALVAKRMLK